MVRARVRVRIWVSEGFCLHPHLHFNRLYDLQIRRSASQHFTCRHQQRPTVKTKVQISCIFRGVIWTAGSDRPMLPNRSNRFW